MSEDLIDILQIGEKIQVEVVYGLAHKQELLSLSVNEGTTIEQAIVES
ncbi:MAG: RnfH family protein, partial [Alteromonadaceae bacterium]